MKMDLWTKIFKASKIFEALLQHWFIYLLTSSLLILGGILTATEQASFWKQRVRMSFSEIYLEGPARQHHLRRGLVRGLDGGLGHHQLRAGAGSHLGQLVPQSSLCSVCDTFYRAMYQVNRGSLSQLRLLHHHILLHSILCHCISNVLWSGLSGIWRASTCGGWGNLANCLQHLPCLLHASITVIS